MKDQYMPVNIRKADQQDIPGILALWEDFMELLRDMNPHYWVVKNGRAAFSRYLERMIGEAGVLVAAAEMGGTGLLGFTLAQVETLPEWFGSEQIGLIRYLAVSDTYRGKDIGQEMAAFTIDWFRSKGISRIELYVLKDLPASDFWSKVGFKVFMDRRYMEI